MALRDVDDERRIGLDERVVEALAVGCERHPIRGGTFLAGLGRPGPVSLMDL